MTNRELIRSLYEALAKKDPGALAELYHEKAVFMDPAFGRLTREEACAMWRMLLTRAADLSIDFEVGEADDYAGTGRWTATYTFSRTGRKVVNPIQSQFGFLDGKVLAHRDRFDFWKWSRQALGLPGLLLGWTPWFRRKFQGRAKTQLAAFMAKERS
jgi:ketosteroid isomerase-like protein